MSKTARSEQKQDSLITSVSVVAPEMQHSHSTVVKADFPYTTKLGVACDVVQRDARAIITFGSTFGTMCSWHVDYNHCGHRQCIMLYITI